MKDDITSLPIYPYLDRITDLLSEHKQLLINAEPGAGKTTLVPWKLLQAGMPVRGKILLLQPRRIAARAAAERIAFLLGERPGETVGLRTRQETVVGRNTRLEAVTEGILVRILQNDQSLGDYDCIIFDEFHERNLTADLGLALALDSRENLRPDLSIIFMSATLSPDTLKPIFDALPRIDVPGRSHPVEVCYHPPLQGEMIREGMARLIIRAYRETRDGSVLAFLPGFSEILGTKKLLEATPGLNSEVSILHGRLPAEEQRAVLSGNSCEKKIILSTNVAETSLTIPGVRAVVDSGFERRVRFSPATGMGHWETVRISASSAEQRKGRAGRLGPGRCLRWWEETEVLPPHPLPEISVADLASLALETAAWGALSAFDLKWITPPPEAHMERAVSLLKRLGFLDASGKITQSGRRASSMGLHPRLARMLDDSHSHASAETAAVTAALLEEGHGLSGNSVDFRDRLESLLAWSGGSREGTSGAAARRVQEEAKRILMSIKSTAAFSPGNIDTGLIGGLLLSAYPDRAAMRDRGDPSRWLLAEGRAARCASPFSGADFIVAPVLDGGRTDARILLATPVSKEEVIHALKTSILEHTVVEWKGWKPLVHSELRADSLVLEKRRSTSIPADELMNLAVSRVREIGLASLPFSTASERLLIRCRFIGKKELLPDWPGFTEESLLEDAESWLAPFGKHDGGAVWDEQSVYAALEFRLGRERRMRLDGLAPEDITLPSGSKKRVEYDGDIPVIAARLQEFFGCAETPLIAGEPALLHLLSPAGRPAQITRDLGGFWKNSYHDVRRELMGRYPRHYWPDNPMEAEPTNRAKPRKKS